MVNDNQNKFIEIFAGLFANEYKSEDIRIEIAPNVILCDSKFLFNKITEEELEIIKDFDDKEDFIKNILKMLKYIGVCAKTAYLQSKYQYADNRIQYANQYINNIDTLQYNRSELMKLI